MTRSQTSNDPSRGSSPQDEELKIVDTAATSPGDSEGDDEKDQDYQDKPRVVEPGQSVVKPAEKPAGVLGAIKEMMRKTNVYVEQLEATRRAALGITEDDAEEEDVEVQATKGKRKASKRQAPKKKQKKEVLPPMDFPQDPLVSGGQLKSYQLEGVSWLIQRYIFAMHGAILADEMGTGKTLQTISFLAWVHTNIHKAEDPASDRPSLIIMPKPVLHNWKAEFERFAPDINVVVYEGKPEERAEIRTKVLGLRGMANAKPEKRKGRYPVILVSYSIAVRDIAFLKNLTYDMVVCDEAHKAKNLKGKTINALQQLKSEFRLLLTGTPLQNNLSELYALLFFILPHIFADQQLFESQFDFSSITTADGTKLSAEEEVQLLVVQLQMLLKPFMLRRCKKDVIKDLPLKKEYVLTAPQTQRQKELTDAAVNGELRSFLAAESTQKRAASEVSAVDTLDSTEDGDGADTPKRRTRSTRAKQAYVEKVDAADDDEFEEQMLERATREQQAEEAARLAKATAKPTTSVRHTQTKFSSAMMNLRQIANHPLLKFDDRTEGGEASSDPEDVVNLSGKMMLLDRLLPELFKQGHKVIIFSQFTSMLDLLAEYFDLRKWDHYRIDGRQENQADQDAIKHFNESPCTSDSINLFILSTRAGGVGINLVGADTVILFDSDWNPQNDLQAMDRAHRIGQKNPVLVFRLATANTVEQTILEAATRKRKLERVVLGSDSLAGGNANDILNNATGRQKKPAGGASGAGGGTKNAEAMKQLAAQLASAEGEKVEIAGAGSEVLSDEQLAGLLDRSEEAMKSVSGPAGVDVVETIEEENVAQTSALADLLEAAQAEEGGAMPSAQTTDDEADDE